MITAENEKYFELIRGAVMHFGGVYSKKGLSEDELKRYEDDFNRVSATLDESEPIRFRNRLTTLHLVCEELSKGGTPPDKSLLVLERFKQNYKALYTD